MLVNGKQIKNGSIGPLKLNLGNNYYPTTPDGVVNKLFIDAFTQVKSPCEITTLLNISSILSASLATIKSSCDTISSALPTINTNDRILVKNQTDASENGIYIWNGTALVRSTDSNVSAMYITGTLCYIKKGDNNKKTFFYLDIPPTFSLGSTNVTWLKLGSNISFYDLISTNQLISTTPNSKVGDIAFVGATEPKDAWILIAADNTVPTNWKQLSSASGSSNIGIPTDGQYGSIFSYSGIVPGDRVEDALDKLDTFIEYISPAKGIPLTSANLIWSVGNPIMYPGKLSTGLTTSWYLDSDIPGNIVNTIFNFSFNLQSSLLINSFNIGLYLNRSTWGITNTNYNNSLSNTLNIVTAASPNTPAPYSSAVVDNNLIINSVSLYNGIWSVAKATITNLNSAEGLKKYSLNHTNAGTSNPLKVFYDINSVSSPPAFATAVNLVEITPVNKVLSNVIYYGLGSTFTLSYIAAAGIFDRTYHPTAVSTYSCIGFTTADVNPVSPPAFNSLFNTNRTVTMDVPNSSSGSTLPSIDVILRKTNGTSLTGNKILSKNICTYGNISTDISDLFFDENRRLLVTNTTSYSTTPYISNTFDYTLDAQVRNGSLVYPVIGDYPSHTFSGDREYQRIFTVGTRSSGSFNFGTLLHSEVSPYGTGDVNILVRLDSIGLFFDLGVPFGTNNGTGSGNSRANSFGAKVTGSSSGTISSFTFGTYSTALSGNAFRIIVIFRNTNKSIQNLIFA